MYFHLKSTLLPLNQVNVVQEISREERNIYIFICNGRSIIQAYLTWLFFGDFWTYIALDNQIYVSFKCIGLIEYIYSYQVS